MFRNKYSVVVFVIAAFGILGLLYYKTNATGTKKYNQAVDTVRYLQRVDADWNAQILRTGVALNKNFDPLAGILPKLRRVRSDLAASEMNADDRALKEVKNQLEKLLALLKQKERMVENFKSGHAVMRNSVRFLPTAESELIKIARQRGENRLINAVRGFLGQIYTFVLLPEQIVGNRLAKALEKLQTARAGATDEVAGALDMFKNHARLILLRNIPTKNLMNESVSLPTSAAARDLIELYDDFHSRRLQTVERYRLGLIAYSGLLVIALVYFGFKLRASYRALNNANISLQEANDTLEQKVEERTRRLKESQSQLVQSEKMAAIGQMVAGVAHEINTPLGYVSSNVDIISEMLGTVEQAIAEFDKLRQLSEIHVIEDKNLKDGFEDINQRLQPIIENELIAESRSLLDDAQFGLTQINDIVVNLKEFSRMDRAKEAEYDINEGLENTLKIAYNTYKHVATIEKAYGDLPKILCHPSQINQVFLNIITNAVHAVAQTGKQGVIKLSTGVSKGFVYVTIRDNGVGMEESVQKRIFEPFYTTKEVGKGTGLGLSISHTIIKEHSGQIKLLSKRGVGTNFLILLPISKVQSSLSSKDSPREMIA